MGQYECQFCEKGKYNRALAYRITKDLSRQELQFILRWRLIEKVLDPKRRKKILGCEK